jgi:NADH dehydrogenase (ubiquinone) 1 alpha subcomplex subunit 8
MLCKAENRDPTHCLKEGRRVTRCAQDLCVWPGYPCRDQLLNKVIRITKMRENCLKQFNEHWNCLEANNQV